MYRRVIIYTFTVMFRNIIVLIYFISFQQQCDSQKSSYRSPSTLTSGHHRQNRGQTFDCTEDNVSLNGVGMAHPLTYATIACVRRDGRYSRRPPRRQNSSETILPPPPSFYSADHPLIVSTDLLNVH
jgi:hypothetical protein